MQAAVLAAPFITSVACAAIFGSAGAGLAGYKMLKRTRGIEEFKFEQYDREGPMSVMIVVSGLMLQEGDYRRAFGAIPIESSLEVFWHSN